MTNFFSKLSKLFINKRHTSTTDSITYFNKNMADKDKAELFIIQAKARCKKGDYGGAINKLDVALNFCPESPNIFVQRGLIKFEMGDVEDALRDIESAIKIDGENLEAYEGRAKIRETLGDSKGAQQDLIKSGELISKKESDALKELDTPKDYLERGNKKIDVGDMDGALKDFDSAIDLNPEFIEAYTCRGSLLKSRGNNEDANRDFEKAKDLSSQKKY